jgi:thiamine pyrophosphate-dependent acetolactate synthase large subunit-like protein
MLHKGAQIVWEGLIREGIQVIFGIPGGAVIPLYHYLVDYPIRHVLMRHEQAAIHAADGYARATGRAGVCVVTSGPGATNLVSGLATAQMAGSPVVAITGQAPTPVLGTDAFQEVDIVSVTSAVTKHNYLVTAVEELPMTIKEAFHIARSGEPGPVLIAIAVDAQRSEAVYVDPGEVHLPGYRPGEQEGAMDEHQAMDGHRGHIEPARAGAEPDANGWMVGVLLHQLCKCGQDRLVVAAEQECEIERLIDCQPRVLLTPGLMGTRGFALPAAIGAQLGLPDEQVWAIAGDDSFQANIQELATVAQERLPLKIAVMERRATIGGSGKQPGPAGTGGFSSRPTGPNLVKLAEAYGIAGLVVRDQHECAAVLSGAMAARYPMLIEFRHTADPDRPD